MGRRIASPENFTEPLSIASPNMLLLPHSAGDPAKRARGGNGLNYWQPRLTPMARYSANSRLGQRLVLERPPATGSGANASPGRVSMTALGHQQRFYTVRPWSGQPHTADLSKNSPSIPLSAKSRLMDRSKQIPIQSPRRRGRAASAARRGRAPSPRSG